MNIKQIKKRWNDLDFCIVSEGKEILEIKNNQEKFGFEFYKSLNNYLIVNDEDFYLPITKKLHRLISDTLDFWCNESINHFYTQEQLDFIKEQYYTKTCKEVVAAFNERFKTNVTYNSIRGAIKRNNFHSSPEKQNAIKGKKQTDFMSEEAIEKSKATCFKKGHTAHNSFPIGYERPNKDGFIEIKVSAPVGENKKRSVWKLKHHLLWEDLNGPIPEGHKVIFADGNNRNFDVDNLILISDSEFMSMRKYGLRYTTSIDAAKSGIVMTKILRKVNGVHSNAKS